MYFLHVPDGTGKTFTVHPIKSILKARKHYIIAIAISTVAASLLEDGRMAHSVFKISIPIYADSVCNISMESKIANELRHASLIIWDEIVMCARYCIEAVNRTSRVIMKPPTVPFAGSWFYSVGISGKYFQLFLVVLKAWSSSCVSSLLHYTNTFIL